MKHFMVYAENGDWDIYAWSAEQAARRVEQITGGRCGRVNHVERIA